MPPARGSGCPTSAPSQRAWGEGSEVAYGEEAPFCLGLSGFRL